jgi:uncharacterized phage protein (TIGR01671 family)
MNREIEFRLWVPEEKAMFYPTHGDLGAGGRNAEGEPILEWSPLVMELPLRTNPNMKHLMQFTGLKHKKGKEIYEGDIVRVGLELYEIGWYVRSSAFLLITIAPRRNENYAASSGVPARDWNWLDCGEAVYWHQSKTSANVQVIGNIYENPELFR